MTDPAEGLNQLITIVVRLLAENGCPWDRRQTPLTLKSYLLEETHEAMAAIDNGQPLEVQEELGDLLFLIVFLCRLYEQQAHFSLGDVVNTINNKMIRRHPHVFGEKKTASEQEMRAHWLAAKQEEKKQRPAAGDPFSSIPKTLPALRRAQRISEHAAHSGFDWPDLAQVFDKLHEETDELRHTLSRHGGQRAKEELGDMLLAIVNIGRLLHLNPEEALHDATDKFIGRYRKMEEIISAAGESMADLDTETLLVRWQAAKNN
jgi:tetrapyrrole methylase family protein/MazG family protein